MRTRPFSPLVALLASLLPHDGFAQAQCPELFGSLAAPRPASTSPKDLPAFELGAENLDREANLFEWYLEGLPDRRLSQAFDSYKTSDYRRMNETLRAENPDFEQLPPIDIKAEHELFKLKKAQDPNHDPGAREFHRLRLLDNASVLEREVFPLGYALKPGTVLSRAVALKENQLPRVGEIFYDHAFMSTSIEADLIDPSEL